MPPASGFCPEVRWRFFVNGAVRDALVRMTSFLALSLFAWDVLL